MPNATGAFALGKSQTAIQPFSYSTVLSALQGNANELQASAYATLPTAQGNPFAADTLLLSTAQAKALGFTPTPTALIAGYDGVIGIISNEELQAGGLSADWTKSAPASANQYYMIGIIEHELTEVMGRYALDGINASYLLMDLFRYFAPGVRQVTDGNPSYFSTDNGNHVLPQQRARAGPLPVMIGYKHHYAGCKSATRTATWGCAITPWRTGAINSHPIGSRLDGLACAP
jgi:hypothetical protein